MIPPKFTAGPDQPVTNVDFVEIATGRGIVKFYGGKSASGYILSSNQFYSDGHNFNAGVSTESGNNTALDIDFDIRWDRPIILQGQSVFYIPLLLTDNAAGGGTFATTLTVLVRKWDGTTETELVSAQKSVSETVGNSTYEGFPCALNMTIPFTAFKIGESLRITVQTTAATGTRSVSLCHDPQGRWPFSSTIGGDGSGDANQVRGGMSSALHAFIPVVMNL